MKRLLIVVALPAILAMIWLGERSPSSAATAEITITTEKVDEVRGLVIYRLATVGATKTTENTDFSGGGSSELAFRVPPARLEEALTTLGDVGGVVTEQRVDLAEVTKSSDRLAEDIDGIGGCIGDVADRLASKNLESAGSDVANCQTKLESVTDRLNTNPTMADDALLAVKIKPMDRSNPFVFAFVGLSALALAVGAFQLLRATRPDDVIDMTDTTTTGAVLDDLYNRRN